MQKLVIIGGSNAFWEISELINDINHVQKKYEIIAVLDDSTKLIGKQYNNLIVEGPVEKAKDFPEDVKSTPFVGPPPPPSIPPDICA